MEFRGTVWVHKCRLKCTAANRENNESKCLHRLRVCILNKPGYRCQRHTLQHELLLLSSFYFLLYIFIPIIMRKKCRKGIDSSTLCIIDESFKKKSWIRRHDTNVRVLFLLGITQRATYQGLPLPEWRANGWFILWVPVIPVLLSSIVGYIWKIFEYFNINHKKKDGSHEIVDILNSLQLGIYDGKQNKQFTYIYYFLQFQVKPLHSVTSYFIRLFGVLNLGHKMVRVKQISSVLIACTPNTWKPEEKSFRLFQSNIKSLHDCRPLGSPMKDLGEVLLVNLSETWNILERR